MRAKRFLARLLASALMLLTLSGAAPGLAQESDSLPYTITVDISSQIVTIYIAGTDEIVRQMLCSTGLNDWTPTGEFILPETRGGSDREPWYQIGNLWVKYATRIWGKVLFHSIPYDKKSMQAIDPQCLKKFGYPASHGCVRLRWQDAQFIAENCMPGTQVSIIKSGKRNESLRELLFQETYDASKGFSYENFLGISSEPGALSRVSEGQEVLNLQYRLRDLGIYDGEMSGEYDSATINAVRVAQYLLGDSLSGVATVDFQEKIYDADAPTAMNVKLTEGMSGPAVHKLQENLQALKLYGDALDSVYDVEVSEAVKGFQRAYCYAADGVATSEVQKAIDYEAGKVREAFGDGDYTCTMTSDALNLAQVTADSGVALREKASQDSKKVKSLRSGAVAVVVEPGKSWTRVRSGSDVGYVKNSLVRFFEQALSLLRYTSESDDRVYTVGSSASDYYAGANLPCDVFAEYLAANGDQSLDIGSLVNYVTVDTRGEAPALNLRESPSTDSAVLATVEDGTSLKVERQFSEWTQVSCGGQEGYLLNDYLSFWTGPDDALEAEAEDELIEASMVAYAVVESVVDAGAAVYDDADDEAALLGHLPDGAQVEVADIAGNWCLIRYMGHEGYMSVEDLQLVMKSAPDAGADELTEENLNT
ncbi:MAG: SH3 domain-containing protein [Clostridia bacterium]|nr:SH3 domain-containing protein [Clostridia bacterium]